jgi:hypothetical protein
LSMIVVYSDDTATPTQDAVALEAAARETATPETTVHDAANGIQTAAAHDSIIPDLDAAISDAATRDSAIRQAAAQLNARRKAALEVSNEAAVARYLANKDAAACGASTVPVTPSTQVAMDAIARNAVARAIAARTSRTRIGAVSPPSDVIVNNAEIPVPPPPPTLAIPLTHPPAPIVSTTSARQSLTTPPATFPDIRHSSIAAPHTQHSATSMTTDRPPHAAVSRTTGFNGVRASTTLTAPVFPRHAAVSSAADPDSVQTSTATGRRALIPTARALAATRHAQDATAHRLAARDQRVRRAEARALHADRNATLEQAEDSEMVRYLRGANRFSFVTYDHVLI